MSFFVDDISYLIKFGEVKYAGSFLGGSLHFGTAKGYRALEDKQKNRGQGDKMENGLRIWTTNMWVISHDNSKMAHFQGNSVVNAFFEPSDNTPVFCLFCCLTSDCKTDSKGQLRIVLPNEVQKDIKEHFLSADTAILIQNPKQYIADVVDSIGTRCIHDIVRYFQVDGYETDQGMRAIDMGLIKYMAQGVTDEHTTIPKGQPISFSANFSYRALFCKDKFFSNEREYRFVLPDIDINEPQNFTIKTQVPITKYKAAQLLSPEGIIVDQ
jgi:hypothetical protein